DEAAAQAVPQPADLALDAAAEMVHAALEGQALDPQAVAELGAAGFVAGEPATKPAAPSSATAWGSRSITWAMAEVTVENCVFSSSVRPRSSLQATAVAHRPSRASMITVVRMTTPGSGTGCCGYY